MKIRRPTLYLIAACLAAAAVWFWLRPTEEKRGDVLSRAFLPELDAGQVSRIEIEHLMNGVQMKKEGENWKAAPLLTKLKKDYDAATQNKTNFKEEWLEADAGKISMSLDVLADTDIISMMGNNPDRHGHFEVNVTAMQVKFFDAAGKKLVHLYLGKAGAGLMEGFVRKENENEVYLTDRFLRNFFPADASYWGGRDESKSEKEKSASTDRKQSPKGP